MDPSTSFSSPCQKVVRWTFALTQYSYFILTILSLCAFILPLVHFCLDENLSREGWKCRSQISVTASHIAFCTFELFSLSFYWWPVVIKLICYGSCVWNLSYHLLFEILDLFLGYLVSKYYVTHSKIRTTFFCLIVIWPFSLAIELLSIYWPFHFWRWVSVISWKSENNNVHNSQQLLSKSHIFILRCLKYFCPLFLVEGSWNKLLSKCARINFWELNVIIFKILLAW